MDNVSHYLRKIISYPPEVFLKKAIKKTLLILYSFFSLFRDRLWKTYSDAMIEADLSRYISSFRFEFGSYTPLIDSLSQKILKHQFDLLGSGLVTVKYGMDCLGVKGFRYKMGSRIEIDSKGNWLKGTINYSNLQSTQRMWKMLESSYTPIDWQIDFKSGFRWQESSLSKQMKYGHKTGIDIKVPWELARMQHLIMLAWSFGLFINNNNKKKAQEYLREFQNEVLDFIATNPPRFGVNWVCTMDVGIRVVNWLVAYDLFRAFGAKFDLEFEKIFSRSIYEHGKHCIENLEYSSELRSNHYLSDIGGLLFVAAYLPQDTEINCWLAFAVQELLSEMEHEFNLDGSNFEASTSYHRLSTEIMLYCSILCLSLSKDKKEVLKNYNPDNLKVYPKLKPYKDQLYDVDKMEFFPDWYWKRLEKAAEFTMHITKPTGEVVQIGDNDSGRFLKIWPSYIINTVAESKKLYKNLKNYNELPEETLYLDENVLDHSHLLRVAGILFERPDFLAFSREVTPEIELVEAWLGKKKIESYHKRQNIQFPTAWNKTIIKIDSDLDKFLEQLQKELSEPLKTQFRISDDSLHLNQGLNVMAYLDFGVYIFKSPRLFLSVRCGSIGQNGYGGHAHNDQLSVELNIDGQDLIRDPGTYIYTPLPEYRNQFRSTFVHYTPQVNGKEQNDWLPGQKGLFGLLGDRTKAECLYFATDGFIGRHFGFGRPVYRVIKIITDSVYIYDFGADHLNYDNTLFSPGYGKWIWYEKRS